MLGGGLLVWQFAKGEKIMSQRVAPLKYLGDEELNQIEETAYRLLEEVGIVLQHPKALELLLGRGCRIQKERVLIPRDVVQWGLKNVTPHTQFYNRDGSPAFAFGDGRLRFHNAGGLPFIYDIDSGERRSPTLQDVCDASRILDKLPNVDVVIPLLGPQDVPQELLAVASTDATLRNTRKPFSAAAIEHPEDVPYVVEMAAACCGGMEAYREKPNMYVSVSPVSPLKFNFNDTASILAVVESGTPFNSLPCPTLGATSPITLAGALAQQHAEVLASFVIAAAAKPGAPVCYCSRVSPIDLRTAVSSWGGPEIGIVGACAVQLAHRLGLPCDSFGLTTSSTRLDPQFAYERFANAFTPALAGMDILSGVGSIASVLAGGLEISVMDDEIISLIKRLVIGCEVTEETLAFDLMQEVILGNGVFLAEAHTVKQIRKGAVWMPTVSDRTGAASGVERAKAKVKEILRTHEVEPLPEAVLRHLDEIKERARRELVK
jgi:trimethylamine---corrinoid protein Co-methyltransferase